MDELQFIFNGIHNDAAEPWQLGFQDSASPALTGIVELHNKIGFFLIVISLSVFWVLLALNNTYNSSKNPIAYKYLTHGTILELVWTITPSLILMAIAFPSFKLLYLMDEVISPTLTIKVVGHQWFWSYELSDFITDNGTAIDFDSYMLPEDSLQLGDFRLLDVDNRLVVPADCHIRLIITSSDVLHSFTVPSLGFKLDACPGRLNQVSFLAERTGVFYGQCSELCGIYHGFMPIVVEAVPSEDFLVWVESAS